MIAHLRSRAPHILAAALLSVGVVAGAPIAVAAPLQVAQGGPPTPIPASVIQDLTKANGNLNALLLAVTADVKANPGLGPQIAALATTLDPVDAAAIAGAAAKADPTAAAEIALAVIEALPPDDRGNDTPAIIAAVTDAAPGSTDLVTTSITGIDLNDGNPRGRVIRGPPIIFPITAFPAASPSGQNNTTTTTMTPPPPPPPVTTANNPLD